MTTEAKIADLLATRDELEQQQKKIEREFVIHERIFDQLMSADEDEDDGDVSTSLLLWALITARNRKTEVTAIKNAIKKIDEQVKKQEADDARNV